MRILRGVCLVVAAGIVLVWARSNWVSDLLIVPMPGGQSMELVTIPTQLRITLSSGWRRDDRVMWYPAGAEPPNWVPVFGRQMIRHGWFPPGVGVVRGARQTPGPTTSGTPAARLSFTYTTVAIPFALPLLLALAYPFGSFWQARLLRRRQQRWLINGRCPACGYDLRASGGRCPECGTQVDPARDARSADVPL